MSGGAGFRLKPVQRNPAFCPNFLTSLTCQLLPRRWTGLWSYSTEEGAFSNWRRFPIPSFPDSSLRKTVKEYPCLSEVQSSVTCWWVAKDFCNLTCRVFHLWTSPLVYTQLSSWGCCLRVILKGKSARSPNELGFHYFSISSATIGQKWYSDYLCLWNPCMELTSCLLVMCNVPSPLPGVPLSRLEAEWTSFS